MEVGFFSAFLPALSAVVWTIFFYMTAWFVIAFIKKRNDVADIAWGLGFIVAAGVPLFL